MKNIKILILISLIFMFKKSECQWLNIYSNSNYYMVSSWFLNPDTGFVCTGHFGLSHGVIRKTVNGGNDLDYC